MKNAPLGKTGLLGSQLAFGTTTFATGVEVALRAKNDIDQKAADTLVDLALASLTGRDLHPQGTNVRFPPSTYFLLTQACAGARAIAPVQHRIVRR